VRSLCRRIGFALATGLATGIGAGARADEAASTTSGAASSDAADATLPNVEVVGHYDNGVGTSDAASQGIILGRLLQDIPLLRPGEVLESIPGMVVTQHSGDGKANQYFLRGYNLDHGTDFRDERRRRAGQHADQRPRAGLHRPQFPDSGADRPHRISQRLLFR
jgi:hypothetical protein